MVLTKIKCIHCESEEVVKKKKRATGIQSLKCRNCGKCFQESYLRQPRTEGVALNKGYGNKMRKMWAKKKAK